MRKLILAAVALLAPLLGHAQQAGVQPASKKVGQWSLEGRMGYYYPTSTTLRNIYDNGGVEFEVELTKSFATTAWQFWSNLSYFNRSGYSIGVPSGTTIQILPISAGFRYVFREDKKVRPYLGLGLTYTFMQTDDQVGGDEVITRNSRLGGVAKSGIYFDFADGFVFDVFLDYSDDNMNFTSSSTNSGTRLNLGGFRFGIGLGHAF